MFDKLYGMMNWPLIEGIEYTDIDNPSDILGQHLIEDGLLIQAFIPDAESVKVKYSGKSYDMYKMDEDGFYAAIIDSDKTIKYKLEVKRGGQVTEFYDAYAFYLAEDIKEYKKINAGIAYEAYDMLGAHKCKVSGVEGVRFCVWAPNAIRVSVVGDFNNWDGRIHQMTRIEDTGLFEIFVPGVEVGALYKYEIKKKGGENVLKADSYSFRVEALPGDASVVADIDSFKWSDGKWLKSRKKSDYNKLPISIYQLSVSNFADENGVANYREIAKPLADYVTKMGYTHVEFMPIAEFYDESTLGYISNFFFAPTNRYGSNEDLMYLVDYLHSKEIGVILDWTPTQFGTTENGMGYFDGSAVYESENPKRAIHPRTGGHMFNYARPEVTSFLIANAFMWIDKYHFDGINLVNTAELLYHDYDRNPGEWEANIYGGTQNLEAIEFLKHFNSITHKLKIGVITIADETSGYPELTGEVTESCLGFDFKWNHEWRKDFLSYMIVPAYLRESHYNELSLSMIYQYSDKFIVGYQAPEFVGGKASMISRMAGDTEQVKFSNMKLALAYEYVHPGKKMMFNGQDMAEYSEWRMNSSFDSEILKVDKHKNINEMVKALNKLYAASPALYELDDDDNGFEWINNISARESVLTFVRKGTNEEDMLLVACNFEAVDRSDYKIGVPQRGKYKEIFNTDSEAFGGNGFVNTRLKQSKTDECDGREESIRVNLAALSISIYQFSKVVEKVSDNKNAKANIAAKTEKKAAAKKTTEKKVTAKKTTEKAESSKKVTEKADTAKKTTPKAVTANEVTDKKADEIKKSEAKESVAEEKSEVKESARKKADVKAEAKVSADKKADVKSEAADKKTADKKTPAKKSSEK